MAPTRIPALLTLMVLIPLSSGEFTETNPSESPDDFLIAIQDPATAIESTRHFRVNATVDAYVNMVGTLPEGYSLSAAFSADGVVFSNVAWDTSTTDPSDSFQVNATDSDPQIRFTLQLPEEANRAEGAVDEVRIVIAHYALTSGTGNGGVLSPSFGHKIRVSYYDDPYAGGGFYQTHPEQNPSTHVVPTDAPVEHVTSTRQFAVNATVDAYVKMVGSLQEGYTLTAEYSPDGATFTPIQWNTSKTDPSTRFTVTAADTASQLRFTLGIPPEANRTAGAVEEVHVGIAHYALTSGTGNGGILNPSFGHKIVVHYEDPVPAPSTSSSSTAPSTSSSTTSTSPASSSATPTSTTQAPTSSSTTPGTSPTTTTSSIGPATSTGPLGPFLEANPSTSSEDPGTNAEDEGPEAQASAIPLAFGVLGLVLAAGITRRRL